MDNSEYQKKKKRKEAVKKFILNFFVWLLIIAFVSTLGVYWGKDAYVNVIKIAKVGKKEFNYYQNSLFHYLLISNREKLAYFLPKSIDQKTFNDYVISYTIETLLNNAYLYNFAQEIGLSPSKDITRFLIENNIKSQLTRNPPKGLIEQAFMEYANFSLASESGDVMNALGVVTISELYSYYELYSYVADAEILIFDYTNYIKKKITDSELESYFNKNYSNYVTEIKVEDIAVPTKELASSIHKYAKEKGFDKALNEYKSKVKYSIETLSRKSGTSKRFNLALNFKEGDVADKVQFENGEYHILKIKEIPTFSKLTKEIKDELYLNYLLENKNSLLTQYKDEIEKTILEVNKLIESGKSFKDVSIALNSKFYKATKIATVSKELYEDKKIIPIRLEDNPELIDYIFTSPLNKVSIINKDEYTIFVKPLSRKIDQNFSYTNINQNVMRDYLHYKATAISKDWMKSLENRYKTVIYTNEIEKLKKGNIED